MTAPRLAVRRRRGQSRPTANLSWTKRVRSTLTICSAAAEEHRPLNSNDDEGRRHSARTCPGAAGRTRTTRSTCVSLAPLREGQREGDRLLLRLGARPERGTALIDFEFMTSRDPSRGWIEPSRTGRSSTPSTRGAPGRNSDGTGSARGTSWFSGTSTAAADSGSAPGPARLPTSAERTRAHPGRVRPGRVQPDRSAVRRPQIDRRRSSTASNASRSLGVIPSSRPPTSSRHSRGLHDPDPDDVSNLSNARRRVTTPDLRWETPSRRGGVLVGSAVRDSAVVTVTPSIGQSRQGACQVLDLQDRHPALCDGTPARSALQVGTPDTGEPSPREHPEPCHSGLRPHLVTVVADTASGRFTPVDAEAGIPGATDFAATECFSVTSVPRLDDDRSELAAADSVTVSATAGGCHGGNGDVHTVQHDQRAAAPPVYTETRHCRRARR